MDPKKKKKADLPPYLLVEATGDSAEVGFDPNVGINQEDEDEDDAESCSCDVSDNNSRVINDIANGCEVDAQEGEVVEDNEEDREGEEVQQTGNGGLHERSCVSAESTREPVSEKEKSRRFWEACLAS
ncbi:hypothetical protein Tsubulata_040094 [Turnera subulata]|uniref:Uncharacterized protein n=1 Tax=Turnera subulata TaxID=218843 RepID=A0A9Q0J9Q8_9ROSI|nr:hypothetical protein Tsubulata_040094 [Turnera subulata]